MNELTARLLASLLDAKCEIDAWAEELEHDNPIRPNDGDGWTVRIAVSGEDMVIIYDADVFFTRLE